MGEKSTMRMEQLESGLRENPHLSGFEGVDFFKQFDRQKSRVVTETGPREKRGAETVEVLPDGHLIYAITGEPHDLRSGSSFDLLNPGFFKRGNSKEARWDAHNLKRALEILGKTQKQVYDSIYKEEYRFYDKMDPSIEYPLSREAFAITVAIDGMEFMRWGADTKKVRDADPERYKDVNKQNLNQAIKELVDRFGEKELTSALKWLIYQHTLRLHIPEQRTEIMLAQNNAFGDVHSDILGFKSDLSKMAVQLIRNAHPVVDNMEVRGYGPVGVGVYNAKSVFGDRELLEILQTDYPEVFQEFVGYLASLPAIDQGAWYGNSKVHPLASVKEFFPDSYELMKAHYKGGLADPEGPAVEFSKKGKKIKSER